MLNDTWMMTFVGGSVTWSSISVNLLPQGRVEHSMTLCQGRDTSHKLFGIFIFGGFTIDSFGNLYYLNDLWFFDLVAMVWSLIIYPSSVVPSVRAGQTMVLMNDQLVLFGGYYDNLYYNDIWRFNISYQVWLFQTLYFNETVLPMVRANHAAVFYNTSLYILAGFGSNSPNFSITIRETFLNDVWEFDFSKCPNNCNNHGYCEYGFCFCNSQYFGLDCQNEMCPSSECYYDATNRSQVCSHCSNQGFCRKAQCSCMAYVGGSDCSYLLCPNDCSSSGSCVLPNGITTPTVDVAPSCVCNFPSTGFDCSTLSCPNNCTSVINGYCAKNNTCICSGCYYGTDCSLGSISCSRVWTIAPVFELHYLLFFITLYLSQIKINY